MEKLLNFKCSECGENIDLDKMPARATVLCPACAKEVTVPSKGKTGALIALIGGGVAILLAGIFIFIFFQVQAQKAAKRRMLDKRKSEAAVRLREVKRIQEEEQQQKRWAELVTRVDKNKLNTEDDFYKISIVIDKFIGADPDEIDKLKIQIKDYKAEAVNKVMTELDAQAKIFAGKNEFMKAVGVYQDYNDEFKPDTEDARSKGAEFYFSKAEEADTARKLAAQKIEEEKQKCIDELAAGLVAGKLKQSIAQFNESPYKKDFPEIAKMIDNVSNVSAIVLKSFENNIGKKINVLLKNGKALLLIKKVEKGKIYAEYKKAKLTIIKKYSLKDLATVEVMKRLAAFDKPTAALMAGIKAVKKQKYDDAEEYFQNTGTFAIPLMSKLELYKEEHEALSANKEKPVKEVEKDLGAINFKKIKIAVKVTKAGKKNLNRGNIQETINTRISVSNLTGQDISGYKLLILLIGESLETKKAFKVIKKFTEPLDMKKQASIQKKLTFVNKYNAGAEIAANDNIMYIPKNGHKYYSWVYVLTDSAGEILQRKAKSKKFTKLIKDILALGTAEFYDTGKPLPGQAKKKPKKKAPLP